MAGVGDIRTCDDVAIGDGVGVVGSTVKQAVNSIYVISYLYNS